jgi:dTMP kinase
MKSFYELLNESRKYYGTSWVAVFRRNPDLEVLIGSRKSDPNKKVLPGGRLDKGESGKDAALRELEEETGISLDDLVKIGKWGKNGYLYASILTKDVSLRPSDDIGGLKWHSIENLPEMEDEHKRMLLHAIQKLFKDKVEEIYNLVPDSILNESTKVDLKAKLKEILKEKPRKQSGLLIVMEGIDGSGKSVNTQELVKWLKDLNYDVVFSEWNSSDIMKKAIKKGKEKRMLTPLIYSLLHAADMVIRYEHDILPALSKNKIVVCDRYIYTSLARDKVRGVDVDMLKEIYKGFRVPDVVFRLKVPIEIAFTRVIRDKGLNYYSAGMDLNLSDNKEESCIKYEAMVDRVYDSIMKEVPTCVTIDASKSIDVIKNKIQKTLKDKFGIGRYK